MFAPAESFISGNVDVSCKLTKLHQTHVLVDCSMLCYKWCLGVGSLPAEDLHHGEERVPCCWSTDLAIPLCDENGSK